jgi:CDP-diacylglycerol--glycerol-3-phosphate 3-phosphatidyltransferase
MVASAGALFCLASGILVAAAGARQPWVLLCVPFAVLVRAAAGRLGVLLQEVYQRGSPGDSLLQEIGAVVSEVALFWPVARVEGLEAWLVTLCCFLAVLTEFAGVVVVDLGAARRRDGPLDATLRLWALTGLCLLLGVGVKPGWWTTGWFQVLPFLQGWTIVRRLRGALAELQPPSAPADGT